jgi:signal peptidase I
LIPIRGIAAEVYAAKPAPAPPAPTQHRLRLWTKRIFVSLLIAIALRTFIGEAAIVPTSSMEGTILVGDHILLNKFLYAPHVPFTDLRLPRWKQVHRGEIIAFHYPRNLELNFIKRVIAGGGDTVEIKDDIVYVNSIPQYEPYAVYTKKAWLRAPESMSARVIPQGQLFVLGDNRDNSDDSRYWGTVPVENVIGEPLMVYFSYKAPSSEWLNDSPLFKLKFYASMILHLPTGTRWERTGKLL